MNRRDFFRRTLGAALAGFAAPLVGPRMVRKLVYDKARRTINPAWVAAGPEADIHFAFNRTVVRCFPDAPPPFPDRLTWWTEHVGPGKFPHIDV